MTKTDLARFAADADSREIASALVQDGGVLIERLATADTMHAILAEVDTNVPRSAQSGSSDLWPEGTRTVGAMAAVSPTYVEHLLVNQKILEIVDAVLKPIKPYTGSLRTDDPSPVTYTDLEDGGQQLVWQTTDAEDSPLCHHYTLGAGVLLEMNGGRETHQFLHRENAIYQPYVEYLGMREFIVSTMWAATDFTVANGATRLVPGSHRWPEARLAQADEIVQAEMPQGSVVLWLSRTLHGAAKTTVDTQRTGLFASYIADWVRQEENQYISVPPEVAEQYSERARQLIGYQCSDIVGWVKGRDKENLLLPGHSGQA